MLICSFSTNWSKEFRQYEKSQQVFIFKKKSIIQFLKLYGNTGSRTAKQSGKLKIKLGDKLPNFKTYYTAPASKQID